MRRGAAGGVGDVDPGGTSRVSSDVELLGYALYVGGARGRASLFSTHPSFSSPLVAPGLPACPSAPHVTFPVLSSTAASSAVASSCARFGYVEACLLGSPLAVLSRDQRLRRPCSISHFE